MDLQPKEVPATVDLLLDDDDETAIQQLMDSGVPI